LAIYDNNDIAPDGKRIAAILANPTFAANGEETP